MKGHVPTPPELADRIVRHLFDARRPIASDRILYPGSGTAPFAAAVERICGETGWEHPNGYGVETDPEHLSVARDRGLGHVEFRARDFLNGDSLDCAPFQYIVGNPPYVPIEGLSADEKSRYKAEFRTAVGRFDLYLLFFERALDLLAPGGVLSFVTPEKFEYVDTAEPLRRLLTADGVHVEEVEHIDEDSFPGLITFPCVTTVRRVTDASGRETRVVLRDGSTHTTVLPADGSSWASSIRDAGLEDAHTGATLGDVTVRVSPGTATGADKIFVADADDVPESIDGRWVRRTVSGSQLQELDGPYTDSVFLCPYDDEGDLADEAELGGFLDWLEQHRERLEDRSCVEGGKKWYAWHETPPMEDLLNPKIAFRDIAKEPRFWVESEGTVVPKHSVYYAIPKDEVPMEELADYLNSPEARMWMEANCQRAHNGYYRLQSRVLSDLPVPRKLANSFQATF